MDPTEIDSKLEAWRDTDSAASKLEAELHKLGQGAQDPRTAELVQQARSLRRDADSLLADIVQSLKDATEAALRSRSR